MEVYWHGLTFFIVIIIIIILIMVIVNYCTLTKLKAEMCLLAQSELYDLAPSCGKYGGYFPRRNYNFDMSGGRYKYFYGRRRSSSRCRYSPRPKSPKRGD